jgi:hypothetical protein
MTPNRRPKFVRLLISAKVVSCSSPLSKLGWRAYRPAAAKSMTETPIAATSTSAAILVNVDHSRFANRRPALRPTSPIPSSAARPTARARIASSGATPR